MEKASKLLRKAEIEYLTPFLKLWLAFNRWYKKAFSYDVSIKTDALAIKKCKDESNNLKAEFLKFFKQDSKESKIFKENIEILFIKNYDYNIRDKDGNLIYDYHLPINERIVFITPMDKVEKKNTTQVYDRVFIFLDNEEKLFCIILDIIYGIRCSLIHGDFDIEDENFLVLIESSYKILFPLMEKILGVGNAN
jgi:hypothetical protein